MGSGDDISIPGFFQLSHYRRADQTPVPGDVDFGIRIHIELFVVIVGGETMALDQLITFS